jgi:tRNA 2-thiouridine synthesizing protein A
MQTKLTIESWYFDGTQLKCPLLFVKVKQQLKQLQPKQQLKVGLTDKIGLKDIKRYLQKNKFEFSISAIDERPIMVTIIGKDS